MKKAILSIAYFCNYFNFINRYFAQKFPKLDISPMDAASYPSNWKEADKVSKSSL